MKKRNIIIAVVAVIVALGIGLVTYLNYELIFAKPPADLNLINITLTISADGTSETYDIETAADNLGDMLVTEGYVKNEKSDYGLYIQTVYGPFKDGRTADGDKEERWSLTKDGQMLMTGADKVVMADGDKYELSLVVGYDNF